MLRPVTNSEAFIASVAGAGDVRDRRMRDRTSLKGRDVGHPGLDSLTPEQRAEAGRKGGAVRSRRTPIPSPPGAA